MPESEPTPSHGRIRHAVVWIWTKLSAPVGATEAGWLRPSSWVAAAILTTFLVYLPWNWFCLRGIDRAYEAATIPDLAGVESTPAAVRTVKEVVGAEPKLQDDGLPEAFAPSQPPRPLHAQLEIYVESVVAGTADTGARQRRAGFIRDRLTGNRSGFAVWLVRTTPTSGVQLVKDLKRADRDWAKKVEARRDAKEYESFLARLADRLSAQVQPQIRPLERMNGFVQWITVLLAWLIVVLCGRRAYWLMTPEGRRTSRSGEADYREVVEVKVYGALAYLLGALPTLGFIGTVMGMGEALLLADGLFAEANKQQAIGRITRELGFAFDTTFVALVAGLLAGLVAVALRSFETGRGVGVTATPVGPASSRTEAVDGFRKG